jgi:hypothetical protein
MFWTPTWFSRVIVTLSASTPVSKSFRVSIAAMNFSRDGWGPARLNASTVAMAVGSPK